MSNTTKLALQGKKTYDIWQEGRIRRNEYGRREKMLLYESK